MTFAIYENIIMNATYVGMDTGRKREQIPGYRLLSVIGGSPEGTTREEAIQQLFAAGYCLQKDQDIRPEMEWPEEVRRQVDSRHFDPSLRCAWADLTPKR